MAKSAAIITVRKPGILISAQWCHLGEIWILMCMVHVVKSPDTSLFTIFQHFHCHMFRGMWRNWPWPTQMQISHPTDVSKFLDYVVSLEA
jgi:hypothetical protein